MCFLRANTGSFLAESLMPLLPRLTQKEDIVLLNFGLHTNDNGSLWNYIQVLSLAKRKGLSTTCCLKALSAVLCISSGLCASLLP